MPHHLAELILCHTDGNRPVRLENVRRLSQEGGEKLLEVVEDVGATGTRLGGHLIHLAFLRVAVSESNSTPGHLALDNDFTSRVVGGAKPRFEFGVERGNGMTLSRRAKALVGRLLRRPIRKPFPRFRAMIRW
jgi:hypothetical protein